MAHDIHILPIRRERTLDGRTLHFVVPALRRVGRHNVEFLKIDEVPPFDGDVAYFECRREGGKMRPIRRVDVPGHMLPMMRSLLL